MNRKTIIKTFLFFVWIVILAACVPQSKGSFLQKDVARREPIPSTAATSATAAPTEPTASPDVPPSPTANAIIGETINQTLEDAQGSVSVVVTPINLGQPGDTIDFDISMNTHSVDLSMNLAMLSTLTTDTGKAVTPLMWEAPMGGHHVSGMLSFPADSDGLRVLEDAQKVTLSIKNVDAPERAFTWQLTTP